MLHRVLQPFFCAKTDLPESVSTCIKFFYNKKNCLHIEVECATIQFMKTCNKCKEQKEANLFYKDLSTNDNLSRSCKSCLYTKKEKTVTNKVCKVCHTNPPLKKRSQCKECYNAWRKSTYVSIKKIKIITAEELELRTQRRKEKEKEYYYKNISKNRERQRINKKNLRKNNSLFRLRSNIGTLIANSFASKGYKKNSKTESILGCSFNDFKRYIESKFLDGMSWKNRAQWHLDHIIPQSFAKTEKETLMLNHYTNFQPLWSTDNLTKSSKITEQAEQHLIYKEITKQRY